MQTTDFFPPIVDDPFRTDDAAANALSDVYAMGGEPNLRSTSCVWRSMDDHGETCVVA
ncbi:MAG: hypothetical protein ACLSDM_03655 [Butyricicoccus sp.]